MSIISVENVTVKFEDNLVLDDISFSIEEGEYVGLIGPNGAGKSTLLKVILGIINPNKGKIIKNKNISFGYVPQNYLLNSYFSISVEEVILMSSYNFFWNSKNEKKRALEVLEMVELNKNFLKKNFQDLSGGQKQRIIIARSLFCNPKVLFFDEPLSGIDFETKIQIYELLSNLNKNNKTTIVFVSHEIETIISKCHKVLCLNKKLYKGCHPIEFTKGEIKNCKIIKTEKEIIPIHHHHFITKE